MDLAIGAGEFKVITLNFGNSYRYRNTTFAADLRVRDGVTGIYPGIEHSLLNDLLRVRAGKGIALHGTSQLAFGFGVNLYPYVIETAMTMPWEGFQKKSGYYQFGLSYRFGYPNFSEVLVGNAAMRSESLKREVGILESRKASLEKMIVTAEVNKGVMDSDMRTLSMRLEDMRARLKNLELEIMDAQKQRENPAPKKAVVIPPPEKWPKKHKVENGDTLRSIASKYYGEPGLWERVFDANQDKITRGLPQVGSVFEIPSPPPKR